MDLVQLLLLMQVYYTAAVIRSKIFVNKLAKVKPVGGNVAKSFIPLTEIPPPRLSIDPLESARRHLIECTTKERAKEENGGPSVDIFPEYYDDKSMKTVATVIFPDHIDHKHFQVTTQVPYLTLGPIDAIGYHPSTIKSEHPSECEKIYQDHLDDQYSEESKDYSEESLEMARMPLFPTDDVPGEMADNVDKQYSDE